MSTTVTSDMITLYKALGDDLVSGQAYKPVAWPTAGLVLSPDWKPAAVCGGGLHLGPTIEHANYYHSAATRWLKCEARLADIVPIPGDTAKCKVRKVVVVAEVDRYGKAVAA